VSAISSLSTKKKYTMSINYLGNKLKRMDKQGLLNGFL